MYWHSSAARLRRCSSLLLHAIISSDTRVMTAMLLILMMEMRHLEGRMQRYLEDYYGREISVQIYRTFSGLHAINLDI